jgi:predicted Fe-Mo cluster-binding NifX family protein
VSYFAAGAWWTANGMAFATQAEADAYEKSGAPNTAGDDFAKAIGKAGTVSPTSSAPAVNAPPPRATTADGLEYLDDGSATPLYYQRDAALHNTGTTTGGKPSNLNNQTDLQTAQGVSGVAGPNGVPTGARNSQGTPIYVTLDPARARVAQETPIFTAVPTGPQGAGFSAQNAGLAAGTGGLIGGKLGGAPGAVMGATAGLLNTLPQARGNGIMLAPGDGSVPGRQGNATEAAAGNARYAATGSSNPSNGQVGLNAPYDQFPTPKATGGVSASGSFQPVQQPTAPSTNIAVPTIQRPSSAQQDSIVNQMLAQGQVQSQYHDAAAGMSSAGTATAGMSTPGVSTYGTSSAGQSQGFDATGFAAEAGQAAQARADGAQRNSDRGDIIKTATSLSNAATQDNADIFANASQRNATAMDMARAERALQHNANTNIGPITVDDTNYLQSRGVSSDIIQRLIAASELPEGPSAAEALMLSAQERATRNAYGDAGSLGGGWRSQLTGQRRALGQAATQQADIAAQMGALRANETAANRDRQVGALNIAGGFSGDMSGRDLELGTTNAQLAEMIAQANQNNAREANFMSGQLTGQRLVSDTGLATDDANRNATIRINNQTNRREALASAGGLQSNMLNSDTAFSTSNADREAQTNIANAGFTTNANIATAGNKTGASIASANNRTSSSISNAQLQTQSSIANALNMTNSSIANAGFSTQSSIANANNQTQASVTNANNQTASSINNANNQTQTSIANANNRVVVDQNNRSNSLTALQNAGVLSSNTRQQDMSLNIAQANNLTQAAIAGANLSGTVFASQMQAAIANQNAQLRQQEINNLQAQVSAAQQKGLSIGGVTLSPNSLAALQQTLGLISLI